MKRRWILSPGRTSTTEPPYTTMRPLLQRTDDERAGGGGPSEKTSPRRQHLNSALGEELGTGPRKHTRAQLHSPAPAGKAATVAHTETLLCEQSLPRNSEFESKVLLLGCPPMVTFPKFQKRYLFTKRFAGRTDQDPLSTPRRCYRETPELFGSWSCCLGDEPM